MATPDLAVTIILDTEKVAGGVITTQEQKVAGLPTGSKEGGNVEQREIISQLGWAGEMAGTKQGDRKKICRKARTTRGGKEKWRNKKLSP